MLIIKKCDKDRDIGIVETHNFYAGTYFTYHLFHFEILLFTGTAHR